MNKTSLYQESMGISLLEVSEMLASSDLIGNSDVSVNRLQMDSREVQSGDIFLALKGERFDAHDFLDDIAKIPNVSAIVQKGSKGKADLLGMSAVCVDNTKEALGEFAKAWRSKHDVPLIAVTGSNGKTTVTQMIASILRAHAGENSLATQGNLNNDIGLPQTLLRLRKNHACAVVELGMNHPGEIEYLAQITKPTVALINNAQREHQEYMNSVQAVALENGQVINALSNKGIAVFPAHDEFTELWIKMCGGKSYLSFSDSKDLTGKTVEKAQVQLTHSSFANGVWTIQVNTPEGVLETQLKIAGEHNVKNALAAIACCLAIKIPLSKISEGLSLFEAVKGRSRSLKLNFNMSDSSSKDDIKINSTSKTTTGSNSEGHMHQVVLDLIDDTYNATPDSVIAAINVLSQMGAPRLLILGDMGEVGDDGPAYHEEVGEYAASKGINAVFGLGDLTLHTVEAFNKGSTQSSLEKGIHFSSMDSLIIGLEHIPTHFKSVLVKGSRFMKMERSVQALESLQKIPLQIIQTQLDAQHKESTCC